MITVMILTGPHAGKRRVMPAETNPFDLVMEFAVDDFRWQIDYAATTAAETLDWGRADMVGRILAALYHGRSVRFEDPSGPREWQSASPGEAHRMAGEIDDAISDSGYNVYVAADGEQSVVISVAGRENPLQ
jgi:hypothetical protein